MLTFLHLSVQLSCVQNLAKFLAPNCLNRHGIDKH